MGLCDPMGAGEGKSHGALPTTRMHCPKMSDGAIGPQEAVEQALLGSVLDRGGKGPQFEGMGMTDGLWLQICKVESTGREQASAIKIAKYTYLDLKMA